VPPCLNSQNEAGTNAAQEQRTTSSNDQTTKREQTKSSSRVDDLTLFARLFVRNVSEPAHDQHSRAGSNHSDIRGIVMATSSLSDLERALQLVKAAGYRVTKPKQRKLTSRGPTCVVSFADGTQCRMTTHCRDEALDWERGVKLCKAAWSTRKALPMAQAPQVVSAHFERDGHILGQAEAA
jgi:hypothetical protein